MLNQMNAPLVQRASGTVGKLSDKGIAGFSFYQGHNAGFGAFAHNRVNFPMPCYPAGFGTGRALGDMAFSREASTAVIGAVAFATLLAGLAQERP